jgi:hypothetical protein
MRREVILLGVALALLLPSHLTAAQTVYKPKRVAVISSSGVNNDFRSWGEYDDRLRVLGWEFDKFRNTELGKFFERAQDYNFVLTTSLWNYGDPQDMRKFVHHWRKYMEAGGIVVFTDMAYPPMCDWLSDLSEDLFISYGDAFKELGAEKASLDTSRLSQFLTKPNRVETLNYWAHFSKWGRGYTVWAWTKAGTAVGLVAPIGRGVLIVTTAWAFSPEMLVNIYANALAIKSGIWAEFVGLPQELAPSTHSVRLTIENLREQPKTVKVILRVTRDEGQMAKVQSLQVSLKGKERKVISVPVTFDWRGKLNLVATISLPEGEVFEVSQPVRIPELVELRLKRTVFVRSDKVEIFVRLNPFQGRRARATVTVRQQGEAPVFTSTLTSSKVISLPAYSLKPGQYLVRAEARENGTGSKRQGAREAGKQTVEMMFEVSDLKSVPTVVRIGARGKLLVNGKVFFPIGTYHVGLEDLKRVRELGFNCVTGPIYAGDQKELKPDQKAWHDEAHRQGLFVITELSEYIRAGRRNYEQARQLVSQLRIHPATIVHYAIDEPMGGGISPETVRKFCQVIAETDPEHPTFVNEVPGAVVQYADIAHITGTDPYPIGSGVPESLSWVGNSVKQAVEAAGGRPVWAVIQAHRQPPPNSANRFPTPEEIRCMAYLALNNGAKGLLFYAWGDVYRTERGEWVSGFKFNEQLQSFFRKFNAELAKIGLHYLLGKVRRDVIKIEPANAPLDAVWIEHGKAKFVVVVNPTPKPVRATISTPLRRFEREFAPLEVHIAQF